MLKKTHSNQELCKVLFLTSPAEYTFQFSHHINYNNSKGILPGCESKGGEGWVK
jgi:hypothetical protein